MRSLLIFLLVLQLSPPTQSVKRRHGDTVSVAWDFVDNEASAGLLFFSIKATPNPNAIPVEIKQVPKADRRATLTVQFNVQDPKYIYYVISAIYENPKGESFPSNTLVVERVGPPPTE